MGTLSPIGAKAKSNTPTTRATADVANHAVVTAADGASHETAIQAVAALTALVREYQRSATSREDQDPYAAIWRRADIDQSAEQANAPKTSAEPALTFGIRRPQSRAAHAANHHQGFGSMPAPEHDDTAAPAPAPQSEATNGHPADDRVPKQGQRVIFANPGEVVMATAGDLVYARPGAQIIGHGYELIELS